MLFDTDLILLKENARKGWKNGCLELLEEFFVTTEERSTIDNENVGDSDCATQWDKKNLTDSSELYTTRFFKKVK